MMRLFEPLGQSLRHSECPLLALVGEQMGDGGSAAQAWAAVKRKRRRDVPLDALTASDLRLLERLFERLGQSGREEQELLLTGTVRALEENCAEAEKRAAEAEKLYVTLGLLIGMMLALIVV